MMHMDNQVLQTLLACEPCWRAGSAECQAIADGLST